MDNQFPEVTSISYQSITFTHCQNSCCSSQKKIKSVNVFNRVFARLIHSRTLLSSLTRWVSLQLHWTKIQEHKKHPTKCKNSFIGSSFITFDLSQILSPPPMCSEHSFYNINIIKNNNLPHESLLHTRQPERPVISVEHVFNIFMRTLQGGRPATTVDMRSRWWWYLFQCLKSHKKSTAIAIKLQIIT